MSTLHQINRNINMIQSTAMTELLPVDGSGTYLVGYVETTLADLLTVFGDPHNENGEKTTAEWSFVTDEGTKFTIYDWKEETTPVEPYRWHIGGINISAIDVVVSIMREHGITVRDYLLHPLTW